MKSGLTFGVRCTGLCPWARILGSVVLVLQGENLPVPSQLFRFLFYYLS